MMKRYQNSIVFDPLETRVFINKKGLTDDNDIMVVDKNDRIMLEYVGFDETAHGQVHFIKEPSLKEKYSIEFKIEKMYKPHLG